MRIDIGNYSRCLRNFSPIRIIPKFSEESNVTRYYLMDSKRILGCFNYDSSGYVDYFKLVDDVRRTKTAANAILSVRDFVIQKAQENGLDFIYFEAPAQKHGLNFLKRMYANLGARLTATDDAFHHFVGILNPKKEAEIVERFSKPAQVEMEFQGSCIFPLSQ